MSARAWLLFVAVSVLWGLPYLFIEVALEELSPVAIVFLRALIGAAVLLPLALTTGALTDLRGRLGAVAVFAMLDIGAPFLLITAGQRAIPSSLAGVLVAAVPLLVALLAIRLDQSERVRGPRLAGLGIGIAGVALLLGVEVRGDARGFLGAGMVLLASLSYAGATLFYKRHLAEVRPVAAIGGALSVSALVLAVPALLSRPAAMPSADALGAVIFLGLFCTALAFVLFYALLNAVGAGRATVVTYVSPAVAVVAGVLVLGEAMTGLGVAGLLLVVAGSWLSTGGRLPPGRRSAPEAVAGGAAAEA